MKKCSRLQLYYTLFCFIVDEPRILPSAIAKKSQYSGRGRSPTTILRHISNMYEQNISQSPRLVLKPFDNCRTIAYLCKKENAKGIKSIFNELRSDKRITYIIMLSGNEFFITSREENIHFRSLDLEIVEKSLLYTPIYTIPRGWNVDMNKALETVVHHDFRKGTLPREIYGDLDWQEIDWNIFEVMRANLRTKLSIVRDRIQENYNTIKNHFFKKVLPSCTIAHYFFPRGYDYYQQLILKARSRYEASITEALQRLPCTSYIFPLEHDFLTVLFHEKTDVTLNAIQKLEEIGIIDNYLLFNPLMHDAPG